LIQVEGPSANGGSGPAEAVLGATMDNGFTDAFPNATFPVYTFSGDSGHKSSCTGACALTYQPVLTDQQPDAGAGVDRHALGIVVRPDGSHQVTYNDKPLYLYVGDAYLPGLFGGPATIGGNASAFGGTFSAIPSP
jgi:predicted lipoprotein with Yx(FWY)xxD motif